MVLAGALLPCAALALSVDGRSQIHAVIGQPLSVAVPVSFAGVNPSTVTVHVIPSPDLPDEEEMVAASVQAVYDADRSVVRLSTPRRLTVPALGLHLVVSAGSLLVNQDIDVLVDVPDLDAQHLARPDAPAAEPETQGTPIRVLTVEKPAAQPGRLYGDASARGGSGEAERPSATPPPPPPPPDPRPRTWQVKPGETLSSISHNLAAAYHVPSEAMALALYEGNSEAFSAKAPEQALAGKHLQVPEDFVVNGEPPSRVALFRNWLRQPHDPWQLRSFPSLLPEAPRGPAEAGLAPWHMAQSLAVVTGATVFLAAAALLLRRLRLRRLVTRYVPMSAVHAKRIKRIIIPTPPPRRGLSQGAVTEKLRIKRLREMLDHNPFRSDIRYRLAERLHKAGDSRGFAQIAPPLRPSLSPEAWARICKMGRELLPDDPRFQG